MVIRISFLVICYDHIKIEYCTLSNNQVYSETMISHWHVYRIVVTLLCTYTSTHQLTTHPTPKTQPKIPTTLNKKNEDKQKEQPSEKTKRYNAISTQLGLLPCPKSLEYQFAHNNIYLAISWFCSVAELARLDTACAYWLVVGTFLLVWDEISDNNCSLSSKADISWSASRNKLLSQWSLERYLIWLWNYRYEECQCDCSKLVSWLIRNWISWTK